MTNLYMADIPPSAAWEMLQKKDVYLVDVRTNVEWKFIGQPNLDSVNKNIISLEWRSLPDMQVNPNFAERLMKEIPNKDSHVLFLCRTGGRSAEAATTMTELGYKNCYNITEGFEGELDSNSHRGTANGWKASNLPWRQA